MHRKKKTFSKQVKKRKTAPKKTRARKPAAAKQNRKRSEAKKSASKKTQKKSISLSKKKPVLQKNKSKKTIPAVKKSADAFNLQKKETGSNPPQQVNEIKSRTQFISPHVLDLKQINQQKQITDQEQENQALLIANDLVKKFNNKKHTLENDLSQFFEDILKKPRNINYKPIYSEENKQKQTVNFPNFSLPKIELPKIQAKDIEIGTFILPAYWKKAAISFVVFCFLFISPFFAYDYYQNLQNKKSNILNQTAQALKHLTFSQKAASAQDLYYTKYELEQAAKSFNQANQEIDDINIITQNLIKLVPEINDQFSSGKNLLSVAEKLSKSASILTETLDQMDLEQPDDLNDLQITNKLKILKNGLNQIHSDIQIANQDLAEVELEKIPQQYQDEIKLLKENLPLFEASIKKYLDTADIMLQILADSGFKRYILAFQNNHELRATGGFIGSFAQIDLYNGNIENITIPGGGPYDLAAGLRVNIEAPQPLQLINPRWEFHDSNWFADVPTSAQKMIWFYEKSSRPTVDGVIFINASFVNKLLKITGPIEMPEYNKTITADNFFDEIQTYVELEYDKQENKPKKIIADLTPKFIDKLLQFKSKEITQTFTLLLNSLSEKEIQLYFSDFVLQREVIKHNWAGQIKDAERDYLHIVSTNIAGQKSDIKIEQEAELNTTINPDGSIINELTITKGHTGEKHQDFYGAQNVDYLRIFVPKGSQLISAEGFSEIPEELFPFIDREIYQPDPDILQIAQTKKIETESNTETYIESNKTVFANWLLTKPGQIVTVKIVYKLPFKLNLEKPDNSFKIFRDDFKADNYEKYSLLWQKQSGKQNFNVKQKVIFPKIFDYQIVYPEKYKQDNNNFEFQTELNTDKLFAIIFKK